MPFLSMRNLPFFSGFIPLLSLAFALSLSSHIISSCLSASAFCLSTKPSAIENYSDSKEAFFWIFFFFSSFPFSSDLKSRERLISLLSSYFDPFEYELDDLEEFDRECYGAPLLLDDSDI